MSISPVGRSLSLVCRRGVSTTSSCHGKEKVYVIGVGMTKFDKPRGSEGPSYVEMAKEAVTNALTDARVSFDAVEAANVGYVFGSSTRGQRAVYELGLSGIPITNSNNNCSTGSSALWLSHNLVAGGLTQCALALGFEKMQKGALSVDDEGVNPLDKHMHTMGKFAGGYSGEPPAPWLFAVAGREHSKRYGTTEKQYAMISVVLVARFHFGISISIFLRINLF